jgi:predicted GIY-YIG superfamily endonuclease
MSAIIVDFNTGEEIHDFTDLGSRATRRSHDIELITIEAIERITDALCREYLVSEEDNFDGRR